MERVRGKYVFLPVEDKCEATLTAVIVGGTGNENSNTSTSKQMHTQIQLKERGEV